MRKLVVLLLIVSAGALNVTAQKGKVTSASNYLANGQIAKALEAIQQAEAHEKSANYYKTYFVKGKVFQAIGESKDAEITKLAEDPFIKAYDAYKKAIELDEKGKVQKSIDLQYPMLNNDFINLGVEQFTANEYKGAVDAFETALEIQQSPVFSGAVDTVIIYNTGLAAYNGKIWETALKYFHKSADLRYGGPEVYQLMNRTYLEMNDSLNAENVLKEGIVAYPDEDVVLLELIQYYLDTEKNEDALEYLETAKTKSPDNEVLWYVEGILYDKKGKKVESTGTYEEANENYEKAIFAYEKAIEVNPEYFDPYYNIGVIHFNKGVYLQGEANKIMDNKKFELAKKKMDDAFGEAIPFFEKAYEHASEDKNKRESLENLKILYYRLQMMDKREEVIKKLEELN